VKQSGGYIFAQSELGRGTTFRIYLPQVEEAADYGTHVRLVEPEARGSETILLVEDEESVRQLVRETLEAKGYKVLEAERGGTALQVAQEQHGPIHMLITDVVMPGMSGRELAEQLAKSHPQTKVLFLSGYTEDAIVHQGVLDPGTAFLQKPFTLQMLSRKVREVLHNEDN
jgi:CheY-like chemotaxis protein